MSKGGELDEVDEADKVEVPGSGSKERSGMEGELMGDRIPEVKEMNEKNDRNQMTTVDEDNVRESLNEGVAYEKQVECKSDISKVVEDALERTINEVAETSLESAAVEGEGLANSTSKKKSKYNWDAPIVKDIIRRVKSHRLSHEKAAEQLSLLMDAKVTTIGVRLQVVKMANDEALAKQDQHSARTKTSKVSTSASKATVAQPDASSVVHESKAPVSCRTRSKTMAMQNADDTKSTKKEFNMDIKVSERMKNDAVVTQNIESAENNNNTSSLVATTSDSTNNQMYMPVIITQTTSPTPMPKSVPPIIRLLDNGGKLTHIAVPENGSYKLYRVSEGCTNASETMPPVNQPVTTATAALSTGTSNILENQLVVRTKVPTNSNLESSGIGTGYIIESVPAQQTLGALVGIPKFVNPQRYGGNNTYLKKYGLSSASNNFQSSIIKRSRNELKEEAKRLIRCVKSQHISSDEAVKQLFEFVDFSPSNVTVADVKASDASDEKKENDQSVDFESVLNGDNCGEIGREPYTKLVDEQGNMNIAIAEGEGYRVYRLNKIVQNREMYKCIDCVFLHKTKKDPIAAVQLTDGILSGDIHPAHHSKCPLQTLSVKECEQNMVSHEGESLLLHDAATDVEETRKGNSGRRSTAIKRQQKQNVRKNRQTTKSTSQKKPRVVPERTLAMTLRKRKARTLTSPGIYDSEVMS